MLNKIITFSVAAYNVEKYISKTLDSFICEKELMDLFEVIIVNDGSKDNTAEIAEKYVEKYPDTFVLLDKENGGYGSTINSSISIAKGKYYKLVDGDDWVATDQLKLFLERLKTEKADLVLTKYCSVDDRDGTVKIMTNGMSFTGDYVENVEDYYFSEKLAMHQIAFRTELLKDIKLHITEKCYYTDVEFNLKPLPYIRSLTAYDLCIYMYRTEREGQSVQRSSWFRNIDQATKVTTNLAVYYEKIKKDIIYQKIRLFMKNSIADSAKNKYVLLMHMPKEMNPQKKIIKFDNKLKKASREIYDRAPLKASRKWSYLIVLLRKTGFKTFNIINAAVRLVKKEK